MTSAPAKPTIGLAGGIGSGKSKVADLLGQLGACVINSDAENRRQLESDEVRGVLESWWGSRVLDERGRVDRRRVAEIVFADAAERQRLEGLLHPRIDAARRKHAAAAQDDPAVRAIVIDAPLLFEAGLDRDCDAVIFVDAPLAVRQARVMATRGWPPDELRRREDSQMPLDSKRVRADYICINDSDEAALARQVEIIFRQIVSRNKPE